ncbi:MAG: AAA family ATPase [Candidatus Rokubacteria bacterium]|nr:AAA family ATPase [Candidatus Rokubacteria bacterium]
MDHTAEDRAVEGEGRQVTVLLAGLEGSLERLGDVTPDERRALLDPLLEQMVEVVRRYDGTVERLTGESIMARFGAGHPEADHAVRASAAALTVQEAASRHRPGSAGRPLALRVGLSSGPVRLPRPASDAAVDDTPTVHLAGRIAEMAHPGSVLASGETVRRAEGCLFEALGTVRIRGVADPVEIFELRGVSPAAMDLGDPVPRTLARLVGREAELERLGQALAEAAAGRGQLLVVTGEPGAGKSRLAWECRRRSRSRSLLLEGSAEPAGRTAAYGPVVALLRSYFGVAAGDDAGCLRERVAAGLLALDEGLVARLPAVMAVLGAPVADARWRALDPAERRGEMLESVSELILGEARREPLLLVVDDVAGLDAETRALLDGLIARLADARLSILLTAGAGAPHGYEENPRATVLPLGPLADGDARALADALLGADARLGPAKRDLLEAARGTPLFLAEGARALAESGELPWPGLEAERPAIEALVAARIAALPPGPRAVLHAAAVIGAEVSRPLLERVTALSAGELRAGLRHLRAGGFLRERQLFPEIEYGFAHPLTRAAAYAGLEAAERRRMHARVVDALEDLHRGRIGDHVEALAHHALAGERWDRALAALRQAGARALARSAHAEAMMCQARALEALRHLPPSRTTLEQAIDVRLDLLRSLWPLGELLEMGERLREAEPLAVALGDQPRHARLLCGQTLHGRHVGDLSRAADSGRRALALARDLDDFPLKIVAATALGMTHHSLANYGAAMGLLRTAANALEGDLARARFGMAGLPAVIARAWLAWCLCEVGAFGAGLVHANVGVQIAESARHPWSQACAQFAAGLLHLRQGEFARATPALCRGLDVARRHRVHAWLAPLAGALGWAHALDGRAREAVPLLEEAVEQSAVMIVKSRHGLRLSWLAEARLVAGRPEEAREGALRALKLASLHGERGQQAWTLRLLGEIYARLEPSAVDAAETHYEHALLLAQELGMRPLAARCRLGLGRLYREAGRFDEASSELTQAAKVFRALEMRSWLARAEGELARAGE